MSQRSCGHHDDTTDNEYNRSSECTSCWLAEEEQMLPALAAALSSPGCPGSGERIELRAAENRYALLSYYAHAIRPRLGVSDEQTQQTARRALTAVLTITSPGWWAIQSIPGETLADAIRNEMSTPA
jgi:hypothetical protein